MPLTVFHGAITFTELNKEEAHWSILPNTIVDLRAYYTYSHGVVPFDYPADPSWAQLFPGLTSLDVPPSSLAPQKMLKPISDSHNEEISQKEIEKFSLSFPATLTALNVLENSRSQPINDVPIIIRAIGHRLRSFSVESQSFTSSAPQLLPNWENPNVKLFNTVSDRYTGNIELAEDENFENLISNKNHPITQLCRSATSLKTGIMPAWAVTFLPKTITSLEMEIVSNGSSFSILSASKAHERNGARSESVDMGTTNIPYNQALGWTQLGWPSALTKLKLNSESEAMRLHFGCLPATLNDLNLYLNAKFEFEGGDLTHMRRLTSFSIYGPTVNDVPLFTSLSALPRSLRTIRASYCSIAEQVFENPEFQDFFDDLQYLTLSPRGLSSDVLRYIPTSLYALILTASEKGADWSEEQFEQISRCSKLVNLNLRGGAAWPATLKFDVFSRYMPKSLTSLQLHIDDWDGEGLAKEIAPHIPPLVSFHTYYSELQELVNSRS